MMAVDPNSPAENRIDNFQSNRQRRIVRVPVLDRNFYHTRDPTENLIRTEGEIKRKIKSNAKIATSKGGRRLADEQHYLHNNSVRKHCSIINPSVFAFQCLIIACGRI